MALFCGASSTMTTLAFRAVISPVSLQTGAQRLTLGGGSHHQLSQASLISLSSVSKLSAITKTAEDDNLVSVLDSEIEYADYEEAPDLPEGFPFEIIDTPGKRSLYLTRKFEDETIRVQVEPISHDDDADDEEEEEEEPNDSDEDEEEIRIPMVINVSKDDDGVSLEFRVSAYADEIVIDSVSIQQPQESENDDQGPDFDDLDENLQKAFHRFLEIRGITPTITDFLAYYVTNKDSREYLHWLKNVKTFVEK